MTNNDRDNIVNVINNSDIKHIIITHGTDTMIETGQYIWNKLSKNGSMNKRIVLTGSMKPEKFINTDAHFNVGFACAAVESMNNGVYICMNGQIFKANNVKRDYNSGHFISKL